ncbi:DNA-binding response regulator [Sphingobium jiangsuense]|uniref:Two-component system response regulator FixJ n=1 Tax=Sphingobium jiangsuense TaxID=870476 RepID=A0A7W6FP10_9SPHN|nr:response regulator transcription factor [Sphingobium jiangsuense]MBB3925631.1 two-component system response regulator FixJ [Sphingobium jiangsuense]GLT01635.1 DNA-binding response regulator [Sphingobium jiangsuense]
MEDRKLVHIVDDDEAVRKSAAYMLKSCGYAVESWPSGGAFLKEVRHAGHGCVLLDIRLPGLDGMEMQRVLAERGVTMPVIIMTGHGNIPIAVRAMKAGAVDFLEKPFEKAVLVKAIETAFEHLVAADGAAARAAEAETILHVLTPRERDVLEGLARGLPNKAIAYDLGISPRTVEVHRANVMAKLEVRSLSDALRIAFAAGMGAPRDGGPRGRESA